MQPQNRVDSPKDMFPVVVFAIALSGGLMVGYLLTDYLLPEGGMIFRFIGALLPPLGLILGLSLAEGVDGVLALLRVFSVLDGRRTFSEVLVMGGKGKQSILVFPTMMATGTTALGVLGAIPIHIFAKPEMQLLDFGAWYGVTGMVYGVGMALLLRFLATDAEA